MVFSISRGQDNNHSSDRIIDSLTTELKKTEEDTTKVQILTNLSGNLINNAPEKAIKYAQKALKLSKKINYTEGINLSYNCFRHYYYITGDYHKAINYCFKLLDINKKAKDMIRISENYNNLGMLYTSAEKYDLAYKYLLKSLQVLKELSRKDPDNDIIQKTTAIAYINIGNIIIIKGNYEKGLEYYLRSIKIYENTEDMNGLRAFYYNFGTMHSKIGNYKTGLKYLHKSLEVNTEQENKFFISAAYSNIGVFYEKMSESESDPEIVTKMLRKALKYHFMSQKIKYELEDTRGIVMIRNNIGSIYEKFGNISLNKDTANYYYNKALDYYKETLQLSEENDHKLFIIYGCSGIASVYFSKEKYREALDFAIKSYKTAKEINDPERIMRSAELLSRVYNALDLYKESFRYYKIYSSSKDSIFNIESTEKIAEMKEKYETEKKDKEIEVLKVEKQLKNSELRAKMKLLYIFISGFIIIMLFFIALFYLYIHKTRSNKQLVLKNLEVVESEKQLQEAYRTLENKYRSEKSTDDQLSFQDGKYKDSALTDEQKHYLKERIKHVMEREKLYLDNDFTIDKLSSYLKTSRSYVSRVINEEFDRNFISFINEYRIKEARRILSDKENLKYTIEAVSKQVGFNSVTTFIRAFKKYTGITPSFFLKSSS